MYDAVCKLLAEKFPNDYANWLLGFSEELTELSPRELSLEPIRADAIMLRQSRRLVLHVEFQTDPDVSLPFRMIDYRVRVYRRYPDKDMRQIVIYLTQTSSPVIRETAFVLPRTRHEFDAVYLWEQPTSQFLHSPGLLPLAVLTQTNDRIAVLNEIAKTIDQIPDKSTQNTLSASAAIIAGLVLEPETITRILRRDIMRQSSMYQEILREGREEGREEGLQQGLQQGLVLAKEQIAQSLLSINMPIEQIATLTGLPLEKVRDLASNQNPKQS